MEDNADAVHAVLSELRLRNFCILWAVCRCFGFAELYPDTIKDGFIKLDRKSR
jgi:hypothetical protein